MNFLEALEANKSWRVKIKSKPNGHWYPRMLLRDHARTGSVILEEMEAEWEVEELPIIVEFENMAARQAGDYGNYGDEHWEVCFKVGKLLANNMAGKTWKVRCEEIK